MPTIPLLTTAADADAWHEVRSPGGYEWWYFDAEDVYRDVKIVAIFFQGFVFHPGYLRRYAQYLKHPTQVAPPMPSEYPCAYFVVYRGGEIVHQFMTQYAASDFAASSTEPRMKIGPNQLRGSESLDLELSGTPWVLTAGGPKLQSDRTLEGRFAFTPKFDHVPQDREFFSPGLSSGATHRWIVANPLCEVSGSIRCGGETIEFNGRGYHDHNYGTAPIGPGLKRWIWGRVLFEDAACTFHYARPQDSRLADEVHLVEADEAGTRELPIAHASSDWSGITGSLLRYPKQLSLDDQLLLSNPRVVDSSPFYMRLIYDAKVRDRMGKAFCEIAYPHRLRWPILGRMIEMSIDRRDRRK